MASPELATVITMLRALKANDSPDLEKSRATFESVGTAFPVPADVRCEPVIAGGVPAEWIRRADATPGVALLYLHGGGYAIGSINTHRALVAPRKQTTHDVHRSKWRGLSIVILEIWNLSFCRAER